MQHPANPLGYFGGSPMFASALEVFAHAAAPRGKPGFELYETVVDGEAVRVAEAIEARKPFGQLKHFKHKGTKDAPKLLIVAPMSGHYAKLLRGTVERLLPGHDVWIKIGRASCRERVCHYVYLSGVSVSLKKNMKIEITT